MSFPKINITFKGLANSAITRSEDGIVALVFTGTDSFIGTVESATEAPEGTAEYVEMALLGANKVIVSAGETLDEALNALELHKFNYVAAPLEGASTVATWVKGLRSNKSKRVKAVVANVAADDEGVINFTTEGIKVGEKEYTAAQYTARIAGILAGTGANESITFKVLPEVDDLETRLTQEEASAKIEAGELVLYHDGEKVKIARGVNSLVTVAGDKSAEFKKIKLIDIMDMIYEDIKRTVEDDFIGKVRNTYANKLLLCNAINAYFEQLEAEEILEVKANHCELDVDAIRVYLRNSGVNLDTLKPAEIKAYNTGDKVFIKAKISMIDSMEIIDFVIAI